MAEAPTFTGPRRRFPTVLIAISAALLWQMAAPEGKVAGLVTVIIQGIVVITAVQVSGAGRRLVGLASGAMAVLVALSTAALFGLDVGPAIPRMVSLTLVLIAPVGIMIGLRDELLEYRRVTLQTVWAGLSLYLLLGLAFAFVYGLVENISGEPFFSHNVDGTSNDFLYFSLSTLTTTGYGDYTAATEVGRTLSVAEALAGQIYLVTVVALLVSNLGHGRPNEPVSVRMAKRLQNPELGSSGDQPST